MLITVDDTTGPMSVFLNVALGCVFGLGFLGYMALWVWIKERGNRAQWPKWLTSLLVGLVFVLGLAAIGLAPASLLHRLKAQGATSMVGGIAFAATIIAVLSLTWLMARDWNRWFGSQQNGTTAGR
jgi:hypothetical protein